MHFGSEIVHCWYENILYILQGQIIPSWSGLIIWCTLEVKFSSVDVEAFYMNTGPHYPKLKSLSMFDTTYASEQLVSVANVNKSKLRQHLTDAHLNALQKAATAHSFVTDFDAVVQTKRCQTLEGKQSHHCVSTIMY